MAGITLRGGRNVRCSFGLRVHRRERTTMASQAVACCDGSARAGMTHHGGFESISVPVTRVALRTRRNVC